MPKMKVSVILPYFQKPIKGCVESIKGQSYKNVELISGTESDFGIKEKKGAGFMRNLLAKKSKGDVLFFIDSDATMDRNCIKNMVEIFNRYDADVVASLPVTPRKSRTTLLNWLLSLDYEDRIRKMGEGIVNVFATTGVGIKRKVFLKTGGFVEVYKGGIGEDWQLASKMHRKGYKIWHSNKVKIYHYPADTFFKYLRKQFYHAWYRPMHTMEFKEVTDSYTSGLMLVQPFLWLLLPFTFINPMLFSLNVLLIFFWDLKKVLKFYKKTKDLYTFLLLPLSAVRSFVWLLGGIRGFWDFYIKGGKK